MKKIALVTGASRGIGKAAALALARDGWTVHVNYIQSRAAAEAVAAQTGGMAICADVSDGQAVEAMFEKIEPVDLLVNNAGVAPNVRCDLLEMTEESFDRVMGINLKGPFFLTQAVGRYFAENKIAGVIVNVGSISATVASISRGEYCLSKAGVAMATKLYAVKMAEFGVPVYEIRPGVISSDMTSVVKEKYDKLIAEGLTLQPRWGEPADIGKAVAMLLRGDLAYSTGQVIKVDGGMEIGRL